MRAEMTQLIMPGDANPMGTAFGGKIMQWIDICAAIAAQRFAKGSVVTASIDRLDFKKPICQGNIVTLKASVNASWTTSMEVGVRVDVEDNPKDRTSFQACKAYLTFVAVDENGKRRKLPEPLIVCTPQSERRWRDANVRRRNRLFSSDGNKTS